MIKPEEFRLGNLITSDGETFKVDSISEDIIHAGALGIYRAGFTEDYGIELTPEWLIKFGFEKRSTYGWKGNGADWQPETSKTENQDFIIWVDNHVFIFRFQTSSWRKEETDTWNSDTTTSIHLAAQYYEKVFEPINVLQELKFVHQLMNLFFFVTGRELELKK